MMLTPETSDFTLTSAARLNKIKAKVNQQFYKAFAFLYFNLLKWQYSEFFLAGDFPVSTLGLGQ